MNTPQDDRAGQESYIEVTPMRRRSHRRKSVYRRPVNKGRVMLGFVFVALLLAGGAYYDYRQTAHYAVFLGQKPLVAMATEAEAERAIVDVKRKYADAAPEVISFKEGRLSVRPFLGHLPAVNGGEAIKRLAGHVTPVMNGYAIFVNRKPMLMLGSEQKAFEAISLMQQRGLAGRRGLPTFRERVTIGEYEQTPTDETRIPVVTPQQAAERLVFPPKENIYTVKKHDSFWSVATANGISVQQLRQLNPGADPRTLDVGDKLKLPDRHSPVTVVVRKMQQ